MLSLIASIGQNREIGVGNELAFTGRGELPYVKATTMGHKIFMGRRTYESLPHRLMGRDYFVLEREVFPAPEWVSVVTDLAGFLAAAQGGGEINVFQAEQPVAIRLNPAEEIFVFGGASLFAQTLDYCDRLYLTEIQATNPAADVFFPEFDRSRYQREEVGRGTYDDGTPFIRYIYRR